MQIANVFCIGICTRLRMHLGPKAGIARIPESGGISIERGACLVQSSTCLSVWSYWTMQSLHEMHDVSLFCFRLIAYDKFNDLYTQWSNSCVVLWPRLNRIGEKGFDLYYNIKYLNYINKYLNYNREGINFFENVYEIYSDTILPNISIIINPKSNNRTRRPAKKSNGETETIVDDRDIPGFGIVVRLSLTWCGTVRGRRLRPLPRGPGAESPRAFLHPWLWRCYAVVLGVPLGAMASAVHNVLKYIGMSMVCWTCWLG